MGVMRNRFANYSGYVIRDKRWPALRLAAKRRDGWTCRDCGSKRRLEVHHVKRVRDFPELAFALDNLKTLCGACHARITRIECGLAPLDPARQQWRNIVRELAHATREERNVGICKNFSPAV
jgi:5-methylcytosine-specific restriction endonuclease McrA